jgi:molecular chaperone GrpE
MTEEHDRTDEVSEVLEDAPQAEAAEVVDAEVVEVTAADDAPAPEPAAEAEPQDEVSVARAEAAQYLDDLRRLKAEFENFRKRVVREQTAVVERAAGTVVERLLPVLDNFDLALIAASSTKDFEAMVRGVELVYSELRDTLHKAGLERMEVVGEVFDPERHEAVMHEDAGDVVVDEMRPGYVFAGRVLRPAMVKVGAKKET